ncbi:hypothetical protein JCM5296_002163 [Sporobolomyces johnsonii]
MPPRQRQSSAPAASQSSHHGSTAVTLHFRERQNGKQPLYRPAALRRNGSHASEMLLNASPPHSPSLATTEAKSTWLGSLAAAAASPWSPVNPDASKELTAPTVRGRMLPKSQWKPDEHAQQCADPDCSLRFDLLNRRHHCRTCGDVFCAAHSSRSTFLWPVSDDEAPHAFTPRGTPRATPRSSALDLPSLAYSVSPTSSAASSNASSNASSISTSSTASSSTPTSSPTPQPALFPVSARVCDRCYFSAPQPLLTPPSYGTPIAPYPANCAFSNPSTRPLTLRHPRSRTPSSSRQSSPGHSPPPVAGSGLGRSKSRSRQGSAASLSTGSEGAAYSSPATSVEGLPSAPGSARKLSSSNRGLSPATSLRQSLPEEEPHLSDEEEGASTEVEDDALPGLKVVHEPPEYLDSSDDEEAEAQHEAHIRERRRLQQEFGSVQGGPWQSWATF